MQIPTTPADGVVLRLITMADVPGLVAAYARNRTHLAPWDPVREDSFFTELGQARRVSGLLTEADAGRAVPLVLAFDDMIIGFVHLSEIVRGPFLSSHLGYWIDGDQQGRGLMTATVAATIEHARHDLGLHRLQAATLLHNTASQRVLLANGFVEIGVARDYLRIAGRWQDHRIFQRLLPS